MTEENGDDNFRKIVDAHLSSFIDGENIDQDYYDSVIDQFEEGILNASRNGYFSRSTYNSENRAALKKLLGIVRKLDELEFNPGVIRLIEYGVLPRNSELGKITGDDKRLVAKLNDLLKEVRMEARLGPIFNAAIDQLKRGKSNVGAEMIVEECCVAWQVLSDQTPPKYISEYDHPLLQFIQAVLDEVLGAGIASARTYFK